MEFNESPVLLLLNPMIDNARKDLPVGVYETGETAAYWGAAAGWAEAVALSCSNSV